VDEKQKMIVSFNEEKDVGTPVVTKGGLARFLPWPITRNVEIFVLNL
jgi:hypothetical protein